MPVLDASYFSLTKGFRTIDCVISQAIEGNIYDAGLTDLAVADTDPIYLQIDTPADKDVTIVALVAKMQAGATTAATLTVNEAPTYTTGSTEVVSYCTNRRLDNTPDTKIYSDPTAISGGTEVFPDLVVGAFGAGSETAVPATLKRDTTYIITMTNISSASAKMLLRVVFGEC